LLPAVIHKFLALLLACNYFAFQVEVFEEEYEKNHRPVSEECSVDSPTLNWESFDKNNAPKAFTLVVETTSDLLCILPQISSAEHPPIVHRSPVRDKSPPTQDIG